MTPKPVTMSITVSVSKEAVDRISRLKRQSYQISAEEIRQMCVSVLRESAEGCEVNVCRSGQVGTFQATNRTSDEWVDEVQVS